MATSRHQPIQHTCPQIDKYIKNIKFAIVKVRDLDRMDAEDIHNAAYNMSCELESCIDYLEELRSSNDTLRQWGIDLAGELDDLESEMASIGRELSNAS